MRAGLIREDGKFSNGVEGITLALIEAKAVHKVPPQQTTAHSQLTLQSLFCRKVRLYILDFS